MLRNTLEALGNLFGNKVVDVAMGIVTSIFILPKIQSLGEIQTLSIPFILTALVVFLLSAVAFQVLGVAFSWIAESITVNYLTVTP
jgi:Ca2+/Na+ antiporter